MADRADEDSSKAAPRAIPVHRPHERQPHNIIGAVLRKHYGKDAELPADDTWRHVAMFLTDYARHP
jgi:hypothetical protein